MEDDLILTIFEQKEDTFNFTDKKLEKARIDSSNNLFSYIDAEIPKQQHTHLTDLINSLLNTSFDCLYNNHKMFYRAGFMDGMALMIDYFDRK